MLKNKKLLYQSTLLVISFAITTPLYGAWYDSIKTAITRLYVQAKSLLYTEQPQFSKTPKEITQKIDVKNPLDKGLQTTLEEIERNNLSSGTTEQWQKVKQFIKQGADSNIATQERKNSALHLALADPNQEIIQNLNIIPFLTDHQANYNQQNCMGYTPEDIETLTPLFRKILQEAKDNCPRTVEP